MVALGARHDSQCRIARQHGEEAVERHGGAAHRAADMGECGVMVGTGRFQDGGGEGRRGLCRGVCGNGVRRCGGGSDAPAVRRKVEQKVNHAQMRAKAPGHHRRLAREGAVQDNHCTSC